MTRIELGSKFVRRGLWLFVFGLVIGYGPWAHYLHGSMDEVQPAFLKNVNQGWGCPWTPAAYVTHLGSLAMLIFGLCYLVSGHTASGPATTAERLALQLCFYSIIAEFIAGYLFYYVVNSIWPSFYYTPIEKRRISPLASKEPVLLSASQETYSRQKESDALWIQLSRNERSSQETKQ